eukprot:gene11090-23187_t
MQDVVTSSLAAPAITFLLNRSLPDDVPAALEEKIFAATATLATGILAASTASATFASVYVDARIPATASVLLPDMAAFARFFYSHYAVSFEASPDPLVSRQSWFDLFCERSGHARQIARHLCDLLDLDDFPDLATVLARCDIPRDICRAVEATATTLHIRDFRPAVSRAIIMELYVGTILRVIATVVPSFRHLLDPSNLPTRSPQPPGPRSRPTTPRSSASGGASSTPHHAIPALAGGGAAIPGVAPAAASSDILALTQLVLQLQAQQSQTAALLASLTSGSIPLSRPAAPLPAPPAASQPAVPSYPPTAAVGVQPPPLLLSPSSHSSRASSLRPRSRSATRSRRSASLQPSHSSEGESDSDFEVLGGDLLLADPAVPLPPPHPAVRFPPSQQAPAPPPAPAGEFLSTSPFQSLLPSPTPSSTANHNPFADIFARARDPQARMCDAPTGAQFALGPSLTHAFNHALSSFFREVYLDVHQFHPLLYELTPLGEAMGIVIPDSRGVPHNYFRRRAKDTAVRLPP